MPGCSRATTLGGTGNIRKGFCCSLDHLCVWPAALFPQPGIYRVNSSTSLFPYICCDTQCSFSIVVCVWVGVSVHISTVHVYVYALQHLNECFKAISSIKIDWDHFSSVSDINQLVSRSLIITSFLDTAGMICLIPPCSKPLSLISGNFLDWVYLCQGCKMCYFNKKKKVQNFFIGIWSKLFIKYMEWWTVVGYMCQMSFHSTRSSSSLETCRNAQKCPHTQS